jgi:hypothetical protein
MPFKKKVAAEPAEEKPVDSATEVAAKQDNTANKPEEKPVDVINSQDLKKKVQDVTTFGNPDAFQLFCKASSKEQGWMKSTKICNVPRTGCVMQTETQIRNPDGSYTSSQALVFIPNVHMHTEGGAPVLGHLLDLD